MLWISLISLFLVISIVVTIFVVILPGKVTGAYGLAAIEFYENGALKTYKSGDPEFNQMVALITVFSFFGGKGSDSGNLSFEVKSDHTVTGVFQGTWVKEGESLIITETASEDKDKDDDDPRSYTLQIKRGQLILKEDEKNGDYHKWIFKK